MPKFLTTSGTSYHIEQIIIGAKKTIILLSPYLFLSKTLLERLSDADKRGVKTFIVYSQNNLRQAEVEVLKTLDNIRIRHSQNLHAKCYFNGQEMIITSMNMYEFSEKNNREMGILIDATEDKELFKDAAEEARSIFDAALKCDISGKIVSSSTPAIPVTIKDVSPKIDSPSKPIAPVVTKKGLSPKKTISEKVPVNLSQSTIPATKGFCIACKGDIDFNVRRPLCRKCYASWAKTSRKRKAPQRYCHECGLEMQTSIAIPRCKTCFVPPKK